MPPLTPSFVALIRCNQRGWGYSTGKQKRGTCVAAYRQRNTEKVSGRRHIKSTKITVETQAGGRGWSSGLVWSESTGMFVWMNSGWEHDDPSDDVGVCGSFIFSCSLSWPHPLLVTSLYMPIRMLWMIWKMAEPQTTKMKRARSQGPTPLSSETFLVDLATFPR